MAEWIKLPKELVVRTYCCCREAERSLDAALPLWLPWEEFTAYYAGERAAALRTLLVRLGGSLPLGLAAAPSPSWEEVIRYLAPPGPVAELFDELIGKRIRGRQRAFGFLPQEVQYIIGRLAALADLLVKKERPQQQDLIAMRMDLFACQRLIDCRCHGLAELDKAQRLSHFGEPGHEPRLRVEDLVERLAQEPGN
jgi:hypothetical protein